MSKIIFNEALIKVLENNPNADHVPERSIVYKSEFKLKAVKGNLEGKA
ncbi:hypothetical protein DFO73_102418 [Cytobacillus oceanisediminis]|uniref:Uncharacterized protein n=1 Tax=Cytobacillus oceanisediminis TaxID=665099 RepID=A0A2V3A6M5_9BACI|nr:hypothetical protein [Cytobacillus oceanisediminis]PWW31419.1 hypothetical protein DFO73_102418 [Cytobacillus oceanisediminis]